MRRQKPPFEKNSKEFAQNKQILLMGYSAADEKDLTNILIAACVGTLIEWYDFFVFGSLAGVTGFAGKVIKFTYTL